MIGIQAAPQPPRYVPVARLRQAMAAGPLEATAGSAPQMPSGTAVVAMAKPDRGRGAEMLEGAPDQVAERILALLSERGLVRT